MMKRNRPIGATSIFPLLVLMTAAVVIFAAVGSAAVLGWLPRAQSADSGASPPPAVYSSRAAAAAPARVAAAPRCEACGTVESVRAVSAGGSSGGLGAVAGGVVGGLLGSQVGRGNGRTLATVAGAGGGAYVGDRIERRMNERLHYRIAVRMDGGGARLVEENGARWKPGDRVRITGGVLAAASAATTD